MKKILSLMLMALPFMAIAQQTSKLEQAFTTEEIALMKTSNSESLKYLEFKADKCFGIADYGDKDLSILPEITELNNLTSKHSMLESSFDNFDAVNFNPLLYNLDLEKGNKVFRFDGPGKVLEIYSDRGCQILFGNSVNPTNK